jgi:hypothetical protein
MSAAPDTKTELAKRELDESRDVTDERDDVANTYEKAMIFPAQNGLPQMQIIINPTIDTGRYIIVLGDEYACAQIKSAHALLVKKWGEAKGAHSLADIVQQLTATLHVKIKLL